MPENECRLDDENWIEIIHAIRHQKCILMMGPDMSIEKKNGYNESLTKILAKKLYERLNDEIKQHINSGNLAEVAQFYWLQKNRSINAVRSFAEQFYRERNNLTSNIHKNLAEIPFYFTITLTPDKMLENAFKEKGITPKIE